jgi:hypothetical protein
MTASVKRLVDCITMIPEASETSVGCALGARFPTAPASDIAMRYYEARLTRPEFDAADLRVNIESKFAFLVLRARQGHVTREADLALASYGRPTDISANPDVPPEGVIGYTFAIRGVRVAFQFTANARSLRAVSFAWSNLPRGRHRAERT